MRNPAQTRQRLLEAAFSEIHRNGFRAASLDSILAETRVTKGALYHHFPSKTSLGYALVEEVLGEYIERRWVQPISTADDPVGLVIESLQAMTDEMGEDEARNGCPLNNLVQEMSGIDEGFRIRLQAVFDRWIKALADAFRRGQAEGTVRADVDPDATAHFVVAAIEGMAGLMKNARSLDAARAPLPAFLSYVESLRPVDPSTPAAN